MMIVTYGRLAGDSNKAGKREHGDLNGMKFKGGGDFVYEWMAGVQ